jgi:Ni,Fe-hydrogenase I large subunit
MARVELNLNLNRVEGDLEIGVTLEDGVIVEARTIGTMYRGFEQIMIGRAARDGLVITPRVCGICGTAHLYVAALALEHAWGVTPPPNAVRIRNLCLLAEGLQNDLRQTLLFFAPDFCNPRYEGESWFAEASREKHLREAQRIAQLGRWELDLVATRTRRFRRDGFAHPRRNRPAAGLARTRGYRNLCDAPAGKIRARARGAACAGRGAVDRRFRCGTVVAGLSQAPAGAVLEDRPLLCQ